MRKQDYATLAAIIRQEVHAARLGVTQGDKLEDHRERYACAVRIAREFAARASVDKEAFLSACGF